MNKFLLVIAALALALTASARHVKNTVSLKTGWNAIYLEATPDDKEAAIGDFFGGLPVTTVAEYVSDAYDDTEQYNSDGTERNQKPISYKVWMKDSRSTLSFLEGGHAYLVRALADCEKEYYGEPKAPHFTYRRTSDGESLANLIGVSLAPGAKPLVTSYFKEGPFGTKGTMYTIGGTGDVPTFKAPFTSSSAKVEAGKAYALSAMQAGRWPGVIEVKSTARNGGVFFAANENTADITLVNRGNEQHSFRVTYRQGEKDTDKVLPLKRSVRNENNLGFSWSEVKPGESWEVTLAPEASESFVFGVERAKLTAEVDLGGVLVFEDLGATQMRVRVPVGIAFPEASAPAKAYPEGLWIGKLMFNRVTFNGAEKPIETEGVLKPTVIFLVDKQNRMTMLQRVSIVESTNGTMRLFKSLNTARAVNDTARRISSLMLDPANQLVVAENGSFGDEVRFSYTVDSQSSGNPFRHAWHPDHDGLNATFDGPTAIGRELWAITNVLTLSFRDTVENKDYYSSDIDEVRIGRAVWRVEGLRSDPIVAEGIFSIQRFLPVSNLE